jgi:2-iminobutanoate/2-iminopropanoate deaminase
VPRTTVATVPPYLPEFTDPNKGVIMKRIIRPEKGAAPKGPYSPGVVAVGATLYVSAQGPFDPETGEVVGATFEEQAEQVFKNLNVIVEEAGVTLLDVVKLTVFITDWAHFAALNEICLRWFSEPYPARTPVKTELPGALFMADAVVALDR